MDKEGTPRGGYYNGGDNSDDNDTNQGYSQDNFGEKEAMQPEFLNNEESNDANKEYTGDYRKENPLKKAENNAAKKIDNNDVKNGEKDPEKPSGFTNSVIGKNATGKGKGKGRFGKAKKTLPTRRWCWLWYLR